MRSRLNILVAAAVMTFVIPQFAMAGDVEDRLRQMDERMNTMEEELQAAQDELDASQAQVSRQESMIQKAGLADEAQSGLAGFYEQVNISGWLAASYFYNFASPYSASLGAQGPSGGAAGLIGNAATNGPVAPFHSDHNSFNVDQLWFEIEKPVSEESRAGFRADILYGNTASRLGAVGIGVNRAAGNFQCNPGASNCGVLAGLEGDPASDIDVFQAYVQYLTPFGPTIKAGKMATWVGSEQVGTVYNFNITRGNVWALLQPINHYGVTLDGETEGGFTYGLGFLNSVRGSAPDTNNNKSFVGKLGWGTDTFDITSTVIWGKEDPGSFGAFGAGGNGSIGTADVVVNWNPTENFSSWVNATYVWSNNQGNGGFKDPSAFGIAAAGRYAFTDRLGLALRAEYVNGNNSFLGLNANTPGLGNKNDSIWGLTGTIDYALTDDLIVKTELRYDHVECDNQPVECDVFTGGKSDAPVGFVRNKSGQILGGVEVVYSF